MNIRLWLPEPPTTWKRAEHGRNGFKYTNLEMDSAQNAIRLAWFEAGRVRLSGPLLLIVRVYLPRLKKNCPVCPVGPTTGDCDNYSKLVMDALQDRPKKGETWAYANDSQILCAPPLKFWATGRGPGTEIYLAELDPCDWWLAGSVPIEKCLREVAGMIERVSE